MDRRQFISTAAGGMGVVAAAAAAQPQPTSPRPARFRLDYAPHFGLFEASAGPDPIQQLRFMADKGFAALEDNWMSRRPVDEQQRIAREMERLGMRMGVFVAHAEFGQVTFASDDPAARDRILSELRAAIETARRVNATWMTVVPGQLDRRVSPGYQTASVIEHLKRCCELCEPAGLVMVLEPLNPRDHPGLLLTRIGQAFEICRAVGSPACKILDDLYHQQVTEGDLISNLDRAWDEIAYVQVGDNPGRFEPTTGEINYRTIFRHLHGKGYQGIVGMEHGASRAGVEGERAVIDAYRWCDGG